MSQPCEDPRLTFDPLADFDFDTLLEGASRLRPDRLALEDPFSAFTFAEADLKSSKLAAAYQEMGLSAGETLLIASGAPALSFVALVAGLRADLNVALAPAWADVETATRAALRCGASALIALPGESALCEADVWLAAAAAAPSIRIVCSVGAELDGAHCLDFDGLSHEGATLGRLRPSRGRITTFESGAKAVSHAQRTLLAAALDLVARVRIGVGSPVLSTIPPTSFAGLMGGPVASLIAGAPLIWNFPFEGREFVRALKRSRPVHLVAPARMGPSIVDAGFLERETLSSLVLLTRLSDFTERADLSALGGARDRESPSVIDLYAFGERAAVAEPRMNDGTPVFPAAEPHYLDFDGRRIMALDWSSEDPARPRIEGAAASGD